MPAARSSSCNCAARIRHLAAYSLSLTALAVNDSEYAAKWRILAAQLHELERAAGIGEVPGRFRDAMPLALDPAHADKDDGSGGEHSARPYRLPLDALQQ